MMSMVSSAASNASGSWSSSTSFTPHTQISPPITATASGSRIFPLQGPLMQNPSDYSTISRCIWKKRRKWLLMISIGWRPFPKSSLPMTLPAQCLVIGDHAICEGTWFGGFGENPRGAALAHPAAARRSDACHPRLHRARRRRTLQDRDGIRHARALVANAGR